MGVDEKGQESERPHQVFLFLPLVTRLAENVSNTQAQEGIETNKEVSRFVEKEVEIERTEIVECCAGCATSKHTYGHVVNVEASMACLGRHAVEGMCYAAAE